MNQVTHQFRDGFILTINTKEDETYNKQNNHSVGLTFSKCAKRTAGSILYLVPI